MHKAAPETSSSHGSPAAIDDTRKSGITWYCFTNAVTSPWGNRSLLIPENTNSPPTSTRATTATHGVAPTRCPNA